MTSDRLKLVFATLFLVLGGLGAGCGSEALEGEDSKAGPWGQQEQELRAGAQELHSAVTHNRCLAIADPETGTLLQSRECDGSDAQRWYARADGLLESAYRRRSNPSAQYCLESASTSPSNGTAVRLGVCSTGKTSQQWSYNNTYRAGPWRSALNGPLGVALCLDVAWSGTQSGASVRLWECNSTNAQRWQRVTVPVLPVSTTQGGMPITITDVSLDFGGNMLWTVAAGASLPATVSYKLSQADYCPYCIDQVIIGFDSEPTAQACIYNNIPPLLPEHVSSSPTVYLKAPSRSGVHYLRFRYAMDYTCEAALAWWSKGTTEENTIGVVIVP
jgi:hypothetical protein